jgi:ATP-binding cassette subfamily B protein
VVDKGRIIERGTHEELLARTGRYAALLREQQRDHEPLAVGAR